MQKTEMTVFVTPKNFLRKTFPNNNKKKKSFPKQLKDNLKHIL